MIDVDEVAAWLRTVPATEEPLTPEELEDLTAVRARGRYTTHEELKAKLAARALMSM